MHLPQIRAAAAAFVPDVSGEAGDAVDGRPEELAQALLDFAQRHPTGGPPPRTWAEVHRHASNLLLAAAHAGALPLAEAGSAGSSRAPGVQPGAAAGGAGEPGEVSPRDMDIVRKIACILVDLPNPSLGPEALCFAANLADVIGGPSQSEVARRHGYTRECVNSHVIAISDALRLPPGRSMRSLEGRNAYINRAHATHGTLRPSSTRPPGQNPWRGNPLAAAVRLRAWAASRPWERLPAGSWDELLAELRPLADLAREICAFIELIADEMEASARRAQAAASTPREGQLLAMCRSVAGLARRESAAPSDAAPGEEPEGEAYVPPTEGPGSPGFFAAEMAAFAGIWRTLNRPARSGEQKRKRKPRRKRKA